MKRPCDDNYLKVFMTLKWFKSLMMGKMSANTHKGDWQAVSVDHLHERLREEWQEYLKADRPSDKVMELADVANICMMLADNIRGASDKAKTT